MPYLFTYFTREDDDGEQIFFSVSEDGLHWQDLSDQPALVWNKGDGGVRDPYIVQHPVTGEYFIMATDLCIKRRHHQWGDAIERGSRDVVFWRSMDLVHWSEPWAVTLAPEGAGCAWAPEAIWDEEEQAFLVIFAPYMPEGDRHRIYASYTRDFQVFTPAFKYIERDNAVIDTTIIHTGGMYYRFSKDEDTAFIGVDKGPSLQGEFTAIPAPLLKNLGALEGPECYQLPDGRWCLICDPYKAHTGYLPIVIDDLDKGEMHPLTPDQYDLGKVLKRHGGVLKISDEAYDTLVKHYGF